MKRLKFTHFLITMLLTGLSYSSAQTFRILPGSFKPCEKLHLYGSGYLSPAILSEDGLDPSIKLTLIYQPLQHLLGQFDYTRSQGFEETDAASIHTSTIIFPEKNTNGFRLHLATPFTLAEKEVVRHQSQILLAPFSEIIFVSPQAPDLNAYSLTGDVLEYQAITLYLGSMLSWEYFPKIYRYGLQGGVFYYRTTIPDASAESFRNIFGDPYLPTIFHGIGAKGAVQMNAFSLSFEIKQNLELVSSSSTSATVNENTGVRKLSELEGFHWDFQIGWAGEILSF